MPNDNQPLLLCVDLQQGSETLARYIARRISHCVQPLHVLYVHPKNGGPAIEDTQAQLDALVVEVLAGVSIKLVTLRHDLPEEAIVAYAKEHAVDPIVLGRRQRSTVERIYVGSTTSAVISLAPCPVLVVPLNLVEQPA